MSIWVWRRSRLHWSESITTSGMAPIHSWKCLKSLSTFRPQLCETFSGVVARTRIRAYNQNRSATFGSRLIHRLNYRIFTTSRSRRLQKNSFLLWLNDKIQVLLTFPEQTLYIWGRNVEITNIFFPWLRLNSQDVPLTSFNRINKMLFIK